MTEVAEIVGEATQMIDDQERGVWAALASDLRFGARHFAALRAGGMSLTELWNESSDALLQLGFESDLVALFAEIRGKTSPERVLEKLAQQQIQIFTLLDDEYPANLKEIAVPPAVLYVRGELAEGPRVAVVGTRKMSSYGKRVTDDLVQPLARAGITIVSGLAIGIDGQAHRSTVDAKGITWAILPGGVDTPYPTSHQPIARQIVEGGGALISEFPPGTGALRHHFPIRNRIIAGLSQATIVIEAAAQSGTLLTAHSALESNRDVFAVPGSIYAAGSEGPHRLLQLGAKLIHSADDVFVELGLQDASQEQQSRAIIPDSPQEAALLNVLGSEPIDLDVLIESVELDSATVMSTLTLMEMKGRARNLGGNQYVRR